MRSQRGSINTSSQRGSGSKTISSTSTPDHKGTTPAEANNLRALVARPWANTQPKNQCGSSEGFTTIPKRNQICGLRIVEQEERKHVIFPLLSGTSALLPLKGSLVTITVDGKSCDVCPRWLLYCLAEPNEKDNHKCSKGKCYDHHLSNPLCFFHSKMGCSKKECSRIHAPELRFDVAPNLDLFRTFEFTPKEFPALVLDKAVCHQSDASAWKQRIEQSLLERQIQNEITELEKNLQKNQALKDARLSLRDYEKDTLAAKNWLETEAYCHMSFDQFCDPFEREILENWNKSHLPFDLYRQSILSKKRVWEADGTITVKEYDQRNDECDEDEKQAATESIVCVPHVLKNQFASFWSWIKDLPIEQDPEVVGSLYFMAGTGLFEEYVKEMRPKSFDQTFEEWIESVPKRRELVELTKKLGCYQKATRYQSLDISSTTMTIKEFEASDPTDVKKWIRVNEIRTVHGNGSLPFDEFMIDKNVYEEYYLHEIYKFKTLEEYREDLSDNWQTMKPYKSIAKPVKQPESQKSLDELLSMVKPLAPKQRVAFTKPVKEDSDESDSDESDSDDSDDSDESDSDESGFGAGFDSGFDMASILNELDRDKVKPLTMSKSTPMNGYIYHEQTIREGGLGQVNGLNVVIGPFSMERLNDVIRLVDDSRKRQGLPCQPKSRINQATKSSSQSFDVFWHDNHSAKIDHSRSQPYKWMLKLIPCLFPNVPLDELLVEIESLKNSIEDEKMESLIVVEASKVKTQQETMSNHEEESPLPCKSKKHGKSKSGKPQLVLK